MPREGPAAIHGGGAAGSCAAAAGFRRLNQWRGKRRPGHSGGHGMAKSGARFPAAARSPPPFGQVRAPRRSAPGAAKGLHPAPVPRRTGHSNAFRRRGGDGSEESEESADLPQCGQGREQSRARPGASGAKRGIRGIGPAPDRNSRRKPLWIRPALPANRKSRGAVLPWPAPIFRSASRRFPSVKANMPAVRMAREHGRAGWEPRSATPSAPRICAASSRPRNSPRRSGARLRPPPEAARSRPAARTTRS